MDFIKKVLTYKGKVVFEKITMPKFKRIPKLYDNNEACFMFLEKGEFTVRSSEYLLEFDNQNALLAKCFNYFFETNPTQWANTKNFELVGVLFYPEIVEEIFDLDLSINIQEPSIDVKSIEVDYLLNNFKENINYLLDHPQLADDHLVLLKLKEFVHLLLKRVGINSVQKFFSALYEPVVYDFKKTIENNIYSNLTIDELASLCNKSLSSFKRKFAEVYQTTPQSYITQKKIEKACQLLTNKSINVSEVAYQCGFEYISKFNRNFKKHIGKSPSEFRNSIN